MTCWPRGAREAGSTKPASRAHPNCRVRRDRVAANGKLRRGSQTTARYAIRRSRGCASGGRLTLMTAADVVELVRVLRVHNVDVVLDGGWGVDALLERQTRPHADLDIA